jgi:hypothetical protein
MSDCVAKPGQEAATFLGRMNFSAGNHAVQGFLAYMHTLWHLESL